jgi:hypothetical protein
MKPLFLAALVALAMPSVACADGQAPLAGAKGVLADLAFETSPFMRRTAYRSVATMNRDVAPSGAYSPVNIEWEKNGKQGKWYIEQQRYGGDLVAGGLAVGDTDAIDRGLRIFAWGWAQQQPDGSFECPDTFHSTSLFVEAVAHALLLLEASPYKDRYAAASAAMKPKLLKAARWMTTPAAEERGKRNNAPYTHRRFLVACALGQTGVLMNDEALVKRSAPYVREGLALQDPAGFFPEKGGWDSSYNAVGLFLAQRYYAIVADDALRPDLYASLGKAAAWQKSRLLPDGTVSVEGNTRVNATPEKGRNGTPKKVAVGHVFRAFAYWARLSGDPSWEALGEKVAAAANMLKRPEPSAARARAGAAG